MEIIYIKIPWLSKSAFYYLDLHLIKKTSLLDSDKNVQNENPSVMHNKHECTKSQGRESKENKTTWENGMG